jgi:hypothetical protein
MTGYFSRLIPSISLALLPGAYGTTID